MKLLTILLMVIISCAFSQVKAQSYEHIDINNIDARVYSSGDLFWDLESDPKYEVPKGSGSHSIFTAAIWMGGLDDGGNLHLSGQTYRQSGTDLQPGPLSTEDGSINETVLQEWDNVWKVSRNDIDAFLAGEDTTEDILNWPAHGDMQHSHAENMAPFVDVSETGTYQPELGDYPDINGDMMLWWVFNDMVKVEETATEAERMSVEVHAKAYGFDNESESVNNTLFFEYTIFNRSSNTYEDVYLGKFVDFDIGYPFNDYIGSFPDINTFFGYVGEEEDPQYGDGPPAQSLTFLNQDMSGFVSYNNTFDLNGNPESPEHYYNYLQGKWKDSSSICWGGNGFRSCWEPDSSVNFMFPHDPNLPRGDDEHWSEITAENPVGDRRGLGTLGPYQFAPGESISVSMGYIFHDEGDHLESVAVIPENVNEVRNFYDDEVATSITDDESPSKETSLNIYPNPAQRSFNVETSGDLIKNVELIDLTGQSVISVKDINKINAEIDLQNVTHGIYIMQVTSLNGQSFTRRVTVE